MGCGMRSVVCSAIAIHTVSISCCDIPWQRMHLIEVGHRFEGLGDIATVSNRRDVTMHRADRFEAHELRSSGRQCPQDACKVARIIMPEDVLFGPAVADTRNHGSVVERIRYNDHAWNGARQCRKR
jgi:hypothetical protein